MRLFSTSLRLRVLGKVAGVQAVIAALLGDQLVVGAALNDTTLLQHHDAVRVAHGGQAMGNDEGRAAIHQAVHAVLHKLLGAGVDGGRCLVQDQHRRVCDSRAGNRQQLALALAQVRAVAGQHRVVAVWQMFDEGIRICELRGGHALLIGGGQAAITDVLHDRAGEQVGILQDDAQRGAQRVLLNGLDVVAVVQDPALLDVVEAVDQVRDRRLARAGGADKGDLLPRTAIQVDVMQDDLLLVVAEVHILKDDVALQLGVPGLAVGIHAFPRPHAGGLVRLGDSIVRFVLGVDQGDVALVDLGLFIQQRKDTRTAGQRHNDGVQLHGDLADGLVELAGQHKEAGEAAQRKAAEAVDSQRTAEDGAEHVGQVAQLAVDGHCYQRIGVCLVGAVEQLIVEPVELLNGNFLMAKDLDDLLAVHHFLNVTVDLAQLLLLLDEVFAGVAGQVLRRQQHDADHRESQHRQGDAQIEHRGQHADEGHNRVDELRQALADHLAQRVNVVRVDRHNVAVGVGVKVFDGQRLHVGEHLVTQVLQRALGDPCHQAVLHKDSGDADAVDDCHAQDSRGQAAEVRAARLEQRQNIAVDQRLGEHDALQLGEHGQQNAAEHHNDLCLIAAHDIGEDALEHLAGVFDLWSGAIAAPAGADLYDFRLLCHYASPPFSSKSPEPLVWLL